jgi:hypothetical protein
MNKQLKNNALCAFDTLKDSKMVIIVGSQWKDVIIISILLTV